MEPTIPHRFQGPIRRPLPIIGVLRGRAHKGPTKELFMGIFSPRQSAYTPPFDGTKPGPTLVGGQSELSPAPNPDNWRIELRRHPIIHRGHAVLALVNPAGETVA